MNPILFRFYLKRSVRYFQNYWQPEPAEVPEAPACQRRGLPRALQAPKQTGAART
jgi:hypothetical protein